MDQLKLKLQALQKDNKLSQHELDTLTSALSNSAFSHNGLRQRHSQAFWNELDENFKNDTDSIKALIANKTITMQDVDSFGHTTLHYAAYFNNYEIAQLCINLGVELHHKNSKGQTALDYAKKSAAHHIEQLLLLSEMKANNNKRMERLSHDINKQNGVVQSMLTVIDEYDQTTRVFFQDALIESMTKLIQRKWIFDDDLLMVSWALEQRNGDVFASKLWSTIKTVCAEIVSSRNKRDWCWLKNSILSSNIWFKIKTNKADVKQEQKTDEDGEIVDANYLYYELLDIVNQEAQHELDGLQTDIGAQASCDDAAWNALVSMQIGAEQLTKLSAGSVVPRQDNIPNGLSATFTQQQLYETATNASFEGDDFYDHYQYLSQLCLLAQTVDAEFQQSMQRVFNVNKLTNIGKLTRKTDATNDICMTYMRGPVKLLKRAREKAENDYCHEAYPTSACILDFNRCALIFEDIASLLYGMQVFIDKVRTYQSGIVIGVVRMKNGFMDYVQLGAQYADHKLNVILRGNTHNIVGEVQFLLRRMYEFKSKAHDLYAIQRDEEFIASSVSKMLPSLTDIKQQIKIAASLGDAKRIVALMVHCNLVVDDILAIDDTTQESILKPICKSGNVTAFRLITSLMSEPQIVSHLFTDHGADKSSRFQCSPIEAAIRNAHHQSLIKEIFSMQPVIQHYTNDKQYLYRFVYNAFVFCGDSESIDVLLQQLGLFSQTDELRDLFEFEYPDKASYFAKEPLILNLSYNTNVQILKKVKDIMGDTQFARHALMVDALNHNALERAIRDNRPDFVRLILELTDIRKAYDVNGADKDTQVTHLLYRLLYWLFVRCVNAEIVDFVLDKLQIRSELVWLLLQYRYPAPTQQQFDVDAMQFHEITIVSQVIVSNPNAVGALQKMVQLIGDEGLAESVLISDGLKNGLEYAIDSNSLAVIKYLLQMNGFKAKLLASKELLWRAVYWLNDRGSIECIQYVVSMLALTQPQVEELIAYQIPKPEDLGAYRADAVPYWNWKIPNTAIKRLLQQ